MWIAVIAVLLSVSQTSNPIPGQATNRATRGGNAVQQQPAKEQRPTASSPVQNPPSTEKDQSKSAEPSNTNTQQTVVIREPVPVSIGKDWWDKGYIILTGVLVLIGGLTLWAIWYQAKQTKIAAEAARDSAKVLIAIERARIDGELVRDIKFVEAVCSLKITNQGKTTAHIFGYDIRYGVITEGLEWSEQTLTKNLTESKQILVGAGDTKTLRDDFNLKQMFTLETGDVTRGVLRVTIRYGDVISDGQRQDHYTSFVYLYNMTLNHLVRDPDYNEYT
jgi:hypothetical protein